MDTRIISLNASVLYLWFHREGIVGNRAWHVMNKDVCHYEGHNPDGAKKNAGTFLSLTSPPAVVQIMKALYKKYSSNRRARGPSESGFRKKQRCISGKYFFWLQMIPSGG